MTTTQTPSALALLAADGPDPALASELALFGRFAGSWDIDLADLQPDGGWAHRPAEWHFAWVLRGRAIQDVLLAPAHGDLPETWGSTFRCYDPRTRRWQVSWFAGDEGRTVHLHARPDGDEIVLEELSGRSRWSFREITDRSFTWHGELATRDGWRLAEVMRATRR
jgi:hypothetical protein